MLAFSGDFFAFKSILLIVLILFSGMHFFKVREFSLKFFIYIFVWCTLFLMSYIYGIINDFEFSVPLFAYYIVTPILAVVLASSFNERRLLFLNKLIVFSTFLVVFLNLYYISYRLGFLPMPDLLLGMRSFGGVKLGNEHLEVRTTSQASLIFLLPYVSTLFFLGGKVFNKKLLFLILLLGFIVVIFSGRRSLQILAFIGIVFNLFLYFMKNKISVSDVLYLLSLLLIGSAVFYFIFDVISLITDLKNPVYTFLNTILLAFDSTEGGGIKRNLQSIALIEYFSLSPLFGHGLNSHATYYRNVFEPWSYEWVYLALLAQTGTLIFAFFILSIFFVGRKILSCYIKSDNDVGIIFAAILNGYVCFIIAGSSNPMVYFIWFWAISLIAFNTAFKYKK